MKQLAMTRRKDKAEGVPPDMLRATKAGQTRAGVARREARGEGEETAFDIWLNRGLHQLFDDVAREPVPDELLRLIEGDRKK